MILEIARECWNGLEPKRNGRVFSSLFFLRLQKQKFGVMTSLRSKYVEDSRGMLSSVYYRDSGWFYFP